MTAYLLERAWADGAVHDDVLVEVVDGRFTSVTPDGPNSRSTRQAWRVQREFHRLGGETPPPIRLPGLALPGLANAHSHAFHRALRGRAQRHGGTFWTWREQMYAVAARLDPDTYLALATATYREMAAAGVTCVGEFHYLHHPSGGGRYGDANAMSHAMVEAARRAGIRIALLDTCYLSSGFGAPVEGVQQRFADGDAGAWAARVEAMQGVVAGAADVVVGAAIHSVRAVPRDQLAVVADHARTHRVPLHAHLSEQPAENDECLAAYGATPAAVLAEAGVWGPGTTAVHATHLSDADVRVLSESCVCLCPTTERDLGDGIGPAPELRDAGVRLTLGSDSHAVIDLFEEARAVELDERLRSRRRGVLAPADLLDAATVHGHASLGYPDAGRIAVGQRADLVLLDTASPRTAGTGADEHTAVFAATAEDVAGVMVDGRWVVEPADSADRAERRRQLGVELDAAVRAVAGEA